MNIQILKKLLPILLIITLINILHAETPFKFKLHSENSINLYIDYESIKNISVKSGRLIDPVKNCVAIIGKDKIFILKLERDNLVKLFDKEFIFDKIKMGPSIPKFVIGDFNQNNLDEVIICLNKILIKVEWDGSQFNTIEYYFPYYIYDCISGDVTNDGISDIILACLPEPIYDNPEKAVGENYRVLLVNFKNNKIDIFYDKIEDLNIGISTAIPPDYLVCASDFDNSATNKLIVSEAQSDVSPTRFRSYIWESQSSCFKLYKKFKIINNSIFNFRDRPQKEMTYFHSLLKPIVIDKKVYLIANEFGKREPCYWGLNSSILKIENDSLEITRLPFTMGRFKLDITTFVEIHYINSKGFIVFSTKNIDGKSSLSYEYYELVQTNNTEYLLSERFQNLESKSKEELRLLRNELFARHGHSFLNTNLKKYFKQQSWYNEIEGEKVTVDKLSSDEKIILQKIIFIERNK